MNEIVSTKEDNNLDGYKLVYPNNKDLKVNILDDNGDRQLHFGKNNLNLSIFENLLYFNKLFISKYNQLNLENNINSFSSTPSLLLTSKNDKVVKILDIKSLKITDSHGNVIEFTHIELIKEIYFNSSTKSIIIVVDEKFCSDEEKKYFREQKVKNDRKEKREQKEKELLKSVEDLLN